MRSISFKFDFNLCLVATIVFIILKLTHVIDWNWFWVFAPLLYDIIVSWYNEWKFWHKH